MSNLNFQGFTPDTYLFLSELAFNNNKPFYEANKERYKASVLQPLQALALDLLPTALEIDPGFNTKPGSIVSRIYRDARRLHGQPPYRDHAWLSFKHPNTAVSDAFCLYFELDPAGYGYGMGMYAPTPAFMAEFRGRVTADPAGFLALQAGLSKYALEGDVYKRDHCPDAPQAVKSYINRRGISWCYYTDKLKNTLDGPGLFNEIRDAFCGMAGMYHFVADKR